MSRATCAPTPSRRLPPGNRPRGREFATPHNRVRDT